MKRQENLSTATPDHLIAEYECEYIHKTRQEDGSWNIPWGWNNYPNEWPLRRIGGKAMAY